jgi:Tol biopolymer transport system component
MHPTRAFVALNLALLILAGCEGTPEPEPRASLAAQSDPSFILPGRILFQSNADGDNEIFILTRDGVRQLTDNDWEDEYPVWSPDGGRIAFASDRNGSYDIFVMAADGTGALAVTGTDQDEREPAWFPDGQSLAYSLETKKLLRRRSALHRVDLDSGETRRLIPDFTSAHGISHISPVGARIVFTGKRTMGWDVALFDWEQGQIRFLEEGGKSCRARFSRDGLRLAYVSARADGKGDIWMMGPEGEGKTRLTIRDRTYDYFPAWSPDGQLVVFNSSLQHDHNGDWQLCLFDLETKAVTILYDSPGNDIFPDWH